MYVVIFSLGMRVPDDEDYNMDTSKLEIIVNDTKTIPTPVYADVSVLQEAIARRVELLIHSEDTEEEGKHRDMKSSTRFFFF